MSIVSFTDVTPQFLTANLINGLAAAIYELKEFIPTQASILLLYRRKAGGFEGDTRDTRDR